MKKLIETDLYHLEVGDNVGWGFKKLCYNNDGSIGSATNLHSLEITAHRPKDNAPILEGVPLMEVRCTCEVGHPYNNLCCHIHGNTESLSEDEVERPTFFEELQSLINRYSIENGSNTPDFILAKYMFSSLINWEDTCKAREEWYGKKMNIGHKASQQSEKKYSKEVIYDLVEEYLQSLVNQTSLNITAIEFIDNYLQSLNKTK